MRVYTYGHEIKYIYIHIHMYRDHIDIIVRIQMVFSALRFGIRVLQLHSYDLWPGELPFSLGDDFICPWLKRKQNQYLKYAKHPTNAQHTSGCLL